MTDHGVSLKNVTDHGVSLKNVTDHGVVPQPQTVPGAHYCTDRDCGHHQCHKEHKRFRNLAEQVSDGHAVASAMGKQLSKAGSENNCNNNKH